MTQAAPATHSGDAEKLDFMDLLGRCLGNFKIAERVLSTFRVTGKADLYQLQQAIESADFQAVATISHRFQGAASNASATKLRELLRTVEQLAREERHSELLMILAWLGPEWDDFEQHSQTYAPATSDRSHFPVRDRTELLGNMPCRC